MCNCLSNQLRHKSTKCVKIPIIRLEIVLALITYRYLTNMLSNVTNQSNASQTKVWRCHAWFNEFCRMSGFRMSF